MGKGLIDGSILQEALAPAQQVTVGVTAHAGGTQALAVPMTTAINRVAVCATAGDSVVLPGTAGNIGVVVTVINAGAQSLNVFPAGSVDQIDALGAATAKAVAAGKTCEFIYVAAGQIHALLSA
jgi:hypothetical protein